MISVQVFEEQMGLLCEYYRRPRLSDGLKAQLFQAIAPHLSEPEFLFACHRAIAEEKYWPAPETLIAKVRGETDASAILWAQIINAIDTNTPVTVPPEGMFALQSIGGFAGLARSTMAERRYLRQEFTVYYRAASAIEKLPTARTFNPPPERCLPIAATAEVAYDPEAVQANARKLRELLSTLGG